MAFRSEYCLLLVGCFYFPFQPFAFSIAKLAPHWCVWLCFHYHCTSFDFCSSVPRAQGTVQTMWWNQAGSAPFSFYLENNMKLLHFCLAPPVLELKAVCVSAALLSHSGVSSLGQCFPLLPMGVLKAVLSAWLCVRSSCKVWRINARTAARWTDVLHYSGLVVTRSHYQGSQVYA